MALTGGVLRSLSVELFTPRSDQGIADLLEKGGRLAAYAALGPSFVSVYGKSLPILEHVRNVHCIRPQLQLSRCDSTVESITSTLDAGLRVGVRDALILAGAPGQKPARGQRQSAEGFESTLELVRFIKGRYGDRVRVAVCGYPQGTHGELDSYEADLLALAQQVAAGAELVVCLPCFDGETHTKYAADARVAGVNCPLLPGVLPVGSNEADFRRTCRAMAVDVPAWLDEQIRAVPTANGLTDFGNALLVRLVRRLQAQGAAPPHVYTLNSAAVLESLALAGFLPLKHRVEHA